MNNLFDDDIGAILRADPDRVFPDGTKSEPNKEVLAPPVSTLETPPPARRPFFKQSTRNKLAAVEEFCEENMPRLNMWIKDVREQDGPKAASEIVLKVMEFYVPKLARSELSGPNGGAMQVQVVKFTETIDMPVEEVKPNDE